MLKHLAGLVLVFAAVTVSWASSADRWVEVRSPHFVVLTNSNEQEARQVAGQFERMRSVFHMLFPAASDAADSPLIVLVFKNEKSFLALAPEGELHKQEFNFASVFLGTPDKDYVLLWLGFPVNHPLLTIYHPWEMVYHDYTFYMLRNVDAWLPLWLKDGLGEFYANTDIRDKYAVLGETSEGEINFLRHNRLLPVTTLLQSDSSSPSAVNKKTGSVFYAESWALTHYLMLHDSEKKTQQIQEYVRLLLQHKDSITAAQEAFGDLTKLQQALHKYVEQSRFKAYRLNTADVVDEASFQVRSVPTPEADAIRADVLVNARRTQDAQALLDNVLQEDPKNVLAHETMGALKFREGDIAGAKQWYGEAIQLGSDSYLAHYYYARTCMQAGDKGEDGAIESNLRAAIKLNPNFAPSYDTLASFYASRHEKLNEAYMLNLEAVQLEPYNLNYRINAADVLAENQKFDSALSVLKFAAEVAKTPAEIDLVQSHIRHIEEYKAKHAPIQSANSPDTKR
ncbi:MAG TPA: DUF1570 domain-containing protein [Acidobacteriaceae bacterium]|jgi:hypothetical protein|nr:DUF1570 domain-containing protein [Acidobacteriaceae bacterium]